MIPSPITNNNVHKLCKTVYIYYVILSLRDIYYSTSVILFPCRYPFNVDISRPIL